MTEQNPPLLRAEGLSCGYAEGQNLFENIDFTLHSGEIVGIKGMSGSGKTTLLYCLSGIIPHLRTAHMSGTVSLGDQLTSDLRLAQIAGRVGFVFQDPDIQLFSAYVEEDLVFGPENLCMERPEMLLRLQETLTALHIDGLQYARSNALSGGQKQLAAIASVLTMGPQVLILDEVTSQLDREGRMLIAEAVRRLRDSGKGLVITDHSRELMMLADRILDLERGEWIEV